MVGVTLRGRNPSDAVVAPPMFGVPIMMIPMYCQVMHGETPHLGRNQDETRTLTTRFGPPSKQAIDDDESDNYIDHIVHAFRVYCSGKVRFGVESRELTALGVQVHMRQDRLCNHLSHLRAYWLLTRDGRSFGSNQGHIIHAHKRGFSPMCPYPQPDPSYVARNNNNRIREEPVVRLT